MNSTTGVWVDTKDIYANEIEMIDKKTDEVRDIEKHM